MSCPPPDVRIVPPKLIVPVKLPATIVLPRWSTATPFGLAVSLTVPPFITLAQASWPGMVVTLLIVTLLVADNEELPERLISVARSSHREAGRTFLWQRI